MFRTMAVSEYEDSSEEEPLTDDETHQEENQVNGDNSGDDESQLDSGSDMFDSDDDEEEAEENGEPQQKLEPFTTKDQPSEDEDFSNDEIDFSQMASLKLDSSSTLAKQTTTLSKTDALPQLIELLEPAETPLEALTRCSANSEVVIKLTECCNVLLSLFDVYDALKEELLRRYAREHGQEFRGTKRRRDEDDDPENEWYFRWVGDETVHGPYSHEQMVEWKHHHFEGQVEVRRSPEGEFVPIDETTDL